MRKLYKITWENKGRQFERVATKTKVFMWAEELMSTGHKVTIEEVE